MYRQGVRVLALLIVAPFCLTVLAQPPCSIQTVIGTWVSAGQGTIYSIPPGSSSPVPVTGVDLGTASIDYQGRISINLTAIAGGQVVPSVADGTVAVNPDCTGTLTAPTAIPGFTMKVDIAILDSGNEIWTIATSGLLGKPAVWQCRWRRIAYLPLPMFQSISNCSTGLLRGTWAGARSGAVLGPLAPLVSAGFLTTGGVDYQGNLSGVFTSSVGGVVTRGEYTGTVTEVKPDCTGTWKWTLTGADGVKLPGEGIEKFVILKGGEEIWSVMLQGVGGAPTGLVGRYQRTSAAPQYK